MFENDCMDDRFGVAVSPDGRTLLTGNYNNCFHLIDADGNIQYELNYKKATTSKVMSKTSTAGKMDYLRKTMAVDFHPTKNIMAVASLNCFYTYSM